MKQIYMLVLGFVGCVAGGCTGNQPFYVDQRFTPEERAEIQAAADSWTAIGAPVDLVLDAKVSEFDTRRVVTRTGNRGAINAWSGFEDVETVAVDLELRRIVVDIDRVPTGQLQMFVAHEFGHSILGPDHSPRPEALMNAEPQVTLPSRWERAAVAELTR